MTDEVIWGCQVVSHWWNIVDSESKICALLYSSVNRIKDQYKVSVRIPPDSEKSSLIRIEGDPQGVQQAKRELLELASRMVRPAARSHQEGACVPVCWVPLWSSLISPRSSEEWESPSLGVALTCWGRGAVPARRWGSAAGFQPWPTRVCDA